MSKFLSVVLTGMVLCVAASVFAQEKVVVVPLMSQGAASTSIYGGGMVTSDGTLSNTFGNTFSINKTGTGVYVIHFPGFDPGCVKSDAGLVLFLSAIDAGFANWNQSYLCTNASGDVDYYVLTKDTGGNMSDHGFNILIMQAD